MITTANTVHLIYLLPSRCRVVCCHSPCILSGAVSAQALVSAGEEELSRADVDQDEPDGNEIAAAAVRDSHVTPRRQQQRVETHQAPHDKGFDFSNPHAMADLLAVSQRARAALQCGTGMVFEMESLGGVLMQVLRPSNPLYDMISLSPSETPPQLTIAFMIMNTRRAQLMQAAYLTSASHFNSCFSASKLAASMCKCAFHTHPHTQLQQQQQQPQLNPTPPNNTPAQ